MTGGAVNTRDALLSVTGASVGGNGFILNGNLTIASHSVDIVCVTITGAAGGRITVGGNVTNRDLLTIAAGIVDVTGTLSTTYTSAVAGSHVTSTTVTTGTLSTAGNTTVAGGVVDPSGATMSVTTGVITIGTAGTPRNLSVSAGSATNTTTTVSEPGRITVSGDATVTGGRPPAETRSSTSPPRPPSAATASSSMAA